MTQAKRLEMESQVSDFHWVTSLVFVHLLVCSCVHLSVTGSCLRAWTRVSRGEDKTSGTEKSSLPSWGNTRRLGGHGKNTNRVIDVFIDLFTVGGCWCLESIRNIVLCCLYDTNCLHNQTHWLWCLLLYLIEWWSHLTHIFIASSNHGFDAVPLVRIGQSNGHTL